MPTPYYDDGTCTIYHGDYWPRLADMGADVLITDPPYAPQGPKFLKELIGVHSTAAVFGYPELLVEWCVDGDLVPDEWVTWSVTNLLANGSFLLPRSSEHVAIFGHVPGAHRIVRPRSEVGKQAIREGYIERRLGDFARDGDVWESAAPGRGFNAASRLHPNEKPLYIMRRLVELCSDPGQLILDTFMGSGTTLRAAKDLGRRAIGIEIEIEERYCEIAARRLGQEVLALA